MIGFWLEDKFYHWGERVDKASLVLKRVRNFTTIAINLVSVVIGVLLLLLTAYGVYVENDVQNLLSFNFWFEPNPVLVVFWVMIIVWLFVYFRLSEAARQKATVAKMVYEAAVPEIVEVTDADLKGKHKNEVARVFNVPAMKAVEEAYELAHRFQHEIEPIHLFVGSLSTKQVSLIFVRLGITFDQVKEPLNKRLNFLAKGKGKLSRTSEETLLASYLNAYTHNRQNVSAIELFMESYNRDEYIQELFYDLDVDQEEMQNVVAWIRISEKLVRRHREYKKAAMRKPTGAMNRAMTSVATPLLDQVSEDLTVEAVYGRLPMLIGREQEMESIFRVIEGGNQSVVLVGQPGVGKDAIVNGIAERMVEERVPKILQDKRLVRISIPHLVSGLTPEKAQERLLMALNEVARSKNIVLVIDNIAEMTGISSGGEMTVDLTSVLIDALNRGYTFLIATSTTDAYTSVIERSSLGQVLQKISVDESETNEAIQTLEAKIGGIEYKNNIIFSYDAVAQAVELSDRYIHDRYLPAKAIEICQETALAVFRDRGKGAVVSEEDVAEIISEKTKIPVTQVGQEEKEKLLHLEEQMHKRMIGQNEAVEEVASALRRARAELRSDNRPIANFLFLGPTGVGKTELAKTTAETYFGDEDMMIRFDMSEYQNPNSIERMIGRKGEGGLLTEAVRQNPFSLLLLDELEKAHPDILNLFLQVMDDGRLTDGAGRTIDFTNIILIATSNAGTPYIQEEVPKGTSLDDIKTHLIEVELKGIYRPEFLNRFDAVTVFKPLTQDDVGQIAYLMINQVAERLEAKGIHLRASDEAVRELAVKGYDPKFGARPLRRVIQEDVDNVVAKAMLEEKVGRRDTIVLEAGGQVKIEKAAEL